MYAVVWEKQAVDDLRRLSKPEADRIFDKVEYHLAKSPDQLGKPLSGDLRGLHSYRVGNYRVLYEMYKETISITVVKVGHR